MSTPHEGGRTERPTEHHDDGEQAKYDRLDESDHSERHSCAGEVTLQTQSQRVERKLHRARSAITDDVVPACMRRCSR